jgi:hypothetical protein
MSSELDAEIGPEAHSFEVSEIKQFSVTSEIDLSEIKTT